MKAEVVADATDIICTVQVTSDLTNPAGWTTSGNTVDQDTASGLPVQDNTPAGSVLQQFIRLLIFRGRKASAALTGGH